MKIKASKMLISDKISCNKEKNCQSITWIQLYSSSSKVYMSNCMFNMHMYLLKYQT